MNLRQIVLKIINELRNEQDKWMVLEDTNALCHINDDWLQIRGVRLYYGGKPLIIWNPILRIRLRLAIRKYLINRINNVLTEK